ncbi:MAG TPA: tRNA-guanine transglycosylase DpdA [Kofleriaceae bacterium]|nr:tRNA-guanine transglycosylase DpdA [Kofleriaceae bacterium]
MQYFLPDSQDLVDPSFDFETERRSATRLRHRDDAYAHELFNERMLDGILVSKGIVDGFGGTGSRYTIAQRQRLLRVGAPEFFRTNDAGWKPIPLMGDCGAFTYVRETEPPYTVEDVAAFYVDCQFDLGISVDHVILEYDASLDADAKAVPDKLKERQAITLRLAREFVRLREADRLPFEPVGVAQGWSPRSYAAAVRELQRMGYSYIALGGMVPLKTPEILESLRAVDAVRRKETRLHLLGITRTESLREFASLGVASFDSTSPLRQAFKDAKDNFYTMDSEFTAIRIPQVEGNASLQKLISSGRVKQDHARRLEQAALAAMREFDRGAASLDATLDALQAYEDVYASGKSHRSEYAVTLEARPWKHCKCDVCRTIGHHVILFRGAERNRRRGLHNTWTFYRRLKRETSPASGAQPKPKTKKPAVGRMSKAAVGES